MPQSLTDVHRLLSPDSETFSTPPTTPDSALIAVIPPSLSRRNSRPSSLRIDHKQSDWNPDIELFTASPDLTKKAHGATPSPQPVTQVPTIVAPSPAKAPLQTLKPVNSPCFVHSHLDKGAQLTDWLKNKQSFVDNSVGVAKSLQHPASSSRSSTTFSPQTSAFESSNDSGDEDEFVGSLTKRLAETAVGVREMSKQLGVLLTFLFDTHD
jgi:NAD+ kinase